MTISSAVSAGISFMRFLSYYGRPQISIREAGTPRHRERAKVGAAMLLDRLKLFCSFGVEIYIQYVYYSGQFSARMPRSCSLACATRRPAPLKLYHCKLQSSARLVLPPFLIQALCNFSGRSHL